MRCVLRLPSLLCLPPCLLQVKGHIGAHELHLHALPPASAPPINIHLVQPQQQRQSPALEETPQQRRRRQERQRQRKREQQQRQREREQLQQAKEEQEEEQEEEGELLLLLGAGLPPPALAQDGGEPPHKRARRLPQRYQQ